MVINNSDSERVRWIHQPITLEHNGFNATIKENGRIIIDNKSSEAGDFDEIEIPAGLVLKLAYILKTTRRGVPMNQKSNE